MKKFVEITTAVLAFVITVWLLAGPAHGQETCIAPAQPLFVWMHPNAAMDFMHHKLVFYRVGHGELKGEWHLYHDDDKTYLSNIAEKIVNGEMKDDKIEWTTVEGKLPK